MFRFLVRVLFLAWRYPHMEERERALFYSSPYKGTNPIMEVPPLWPHLNLITSPKSHLQMLLYWEPGLKHTSLQGATQTFSPEHIVMLWDHYCASVYRCGNDRLMKWSNLAKVIQQVPRHKPTSAKFISCQCMALVLEYQRRLLVCLEGGSNH